MAVENPAGRAFRIIFLLCHAPEQLALRRSHSEGDQFTFFVLYFVEMIEPPPGIAQFCHNEQTLFSLGHF
ncbi:hypothetical protein EC40522_5581 [Escherichia coli 4.0522]|nr:hypothetical protein EC40522_5581 [Escherichia coli 4.0522]